MLEKSHPLFFSSYAECGAGHCQTYCNICYEIFGTPSMECLSQLLDYQCFAKFRNSMALIDSTGHCDWGNVNGWVSASAHEDILTVTLWFIDLFIFVVSEGFTATWATARRTYLTACRSRGPTHWWRGGLWRSTRIFSWTVPPRSWATPHLPSSLPWSSPRYVLSPSWLALWCLRPKTETAARKDSLLPLFVCLQWLQQSAIADSKH